MQGKEFKPTEADRANVIEWAGMGFTTASIGRKLSVTRHTVEKHFQEELALGKAEIETLAVSQIVEAIKKGEAWAICFFLKCRCGWKEKSGLELSGPDGGAIQHTINPLDALEGELARIHARETAAGDPGQPGAIGS